MEKVIDIRPLKKKLRAEAREMRRAMSPDRKQSLDRKIKNKLLNLWSVREAKAVLCYVSTDIEVDTREFINALLAMGKRVAVPRCEGEKSNMNFYYINSLDELDVGSFGVDEPDPTKHIMVGDTKDCVCIVPAFMFDKQGFRLGYGKGYYDRYLSRYKGSTIGICYSENLVDELFHGKYDRTVDMIITEKDIISDIKGGHGNG
ncbi:MAG: 5-formyltetrahydrofolate cyclo-ligase [Clostridia bacterium]|nr:5-formyltetrahydrofolate cyclo-ligase [Clostridia bacterium]